VCTGTSIYNILQFNKLAPRQQTFKQDSKLLSHFLVRRKPW
jgi:hypothetical protein